PNHSVVHINNGHVTGRTVGSPVSELGIKKIRSGNFDQDMVNYIVHTPEGHVLKCASIYFTDQEISYSLGINFDYTNLVNALGSLENLVQTNTEMEDEYANHPNLILNKMFHEAIKNINHPVTSFTKEDKIKVVQLLDDMGAFLLRHGVMFIAEKLDVSRYTIYNYLKKEK
ncbi:MAG: helix-turn-helix domain-containing protein, partial [Clostridiales bacterium]